MSRVYSVISMGKCSQTNIKVMASYPKQNAKKNIFNFTVRYLNNSLPVRKNMYLWKKVTNSSCNFCLQPETLNHVIAGCKTYLDTKHYKWSHDSVLLFIAKTLSSVLNYCIYADLNGFNSPSIVTDDENRPDCILRRS